MLYLLNRRVKVALKPIDAKDEDEDVQRERLRIERGGGSSDILRVDNLTKVNIAIYLFAWALRCLYPE